MKVMYERRCTHVGKVEVRNWESYSKEGEERREEGE